MSLATPPSGARSSPSPWFFLALTLGAVAIVTVALLMLTRRREEPKEVLLVRGSGEVEYGGRPVGIAGDPRVVVIENQGRRPVGVRSVRMDGGEAGDFVVLRDDCTGRTLPPDQGCAIVAAFVPTAVGPRAARLVVVGEGPERAVVLRGAGEAAEGASLAGGVEGAPRLEAEPLRIDFGSQPPGTTGGPVPITFVNRGAGTSRPVVRLDAGPTREFAITDDECTNAVLPAGRACMVEVVFRPGGQGLRGAVLTMRDAVTNAVRTVALTGRGAAEAVTETPIVESATEATAARVATTYQLTGPDRITFRRQALRTRSATQSVVLENPGREEVRVSTVRIAGINAGSYGLANDRCSGAILGASARCGFDVWFLPSGTGEQRASLVVRDGAGDVAREIVLTGTGG